MATNFQTTDITNSTLNVATGDHTIILGDVNILHSSNVAVSLTEGIGLAQLTNYGFIAGTSTTATVDIDADTATVINHGTIINTSSSGTFSPAILLSGGDSLGAGTTTSIFNTGTITSNKVIIDVFGNSGDFSLVLNNSGTMISYEGATILQDDANLVDANIVNSGLISGGEIGASGSGTTTIMNSGRIESSDVDAAGALGMTLFNSGDIVGYNGGNSLIRGSVVADTVTNTGLIIGTVSLNSGNDTFNGYGGTVIGTIDGGADDDTFFIDQANATIDGGLGNDTLYARSDVLNATRIEEIALRGDGNFTAIADDITTRMIGNQGNNVLLGGATGNTILAGGGDDVASGFAGNDTLRGNAGNDELNGGDNDDLLFGGTGNDTLNGGAGQDFLYGNQGADTFVFEAVSDTGIGAARDIILGFNRGADVVDLSAINDASFNFIGTSAFSGSGALELRYFVVASVHTAVELDENGDGITDAQILLRGLTEVDAGDFVL